MANVSKLPLRLPVPVVGTGFNRWLYGDAPVPPAVHDWSALLRDVARSEGLLPDDKLEAKLAKDGDPTFAWEAVLIAATGRAQGPAGTPARRKASDVEQGMLRQVRSVLKQASGVAVERSDVRERALRFIESLTLDGTRPADVVTLNLDDSLQRIIAKSGASIRVAPVHGGDGDFASGVFGVQRYGRALSAVSEAFDGFKKRERERGDKATELDCANAHRTSLQPDSHWLCVALNAPLLLLGVGLHRAEVDLWHFLHLRARNHARLPPASWPPIFRLTCDEEQATKNGHWRSLPAPVEILPLHLGRTWAEAWEELIALLRSPNAFTTSPRAACSSCR